MHIWIHLTFLLILAFCLWIFIATCNAYDQIVDECQSQIVEEPEEKIALEPICEFNKINNHYGVATSIFKQTFIILFGYLSYNIL